MARPYHTVGIGSDTCGNYIAYRKTNESMALGFIVWTEGYISGYNNCMAADGDITSGAVDADTLEAWFDSYCQGHPLEHLGTATQVLIEEFKARKR
jgi:hypothetical protein